MSDQSIPTPANPPLTGLLLSRDLIFKTKITDTAAALGYLIRVVDDASRAVSLIKTTYPRVVFVDLTAGELIAPARLAEYRKAASPDVRFVAFGPHVDSESLAAAKAAGCHAVLTRSKFTAKLSELLRVYFE
jgi:hypothetical protein